MKKTTPTINHIQHNTPSWRVARISIFTALCAAGAFLKIPSPVGSLALDSAAGFFVALYFGAAEGALVCGLGHLATAVVSGFPLGYLHLPIALGMALAGAAVGLINKTHRTWGFPPALAAGVAINTGSTFFVVPDPNYGLALALAFLSFVFAAAVLNVFIAGLAYVGIRGRIQL
ncbi:MAG: ECF transporter S component [Candidatus Bathyarchaeota archaeon]|nr:ECF transporter S component [Candidatus Bathyarchaeota archaeon]